MGIFRVEVILRGSFPGGNLLCKNYLGGDFPGGSYPGWELSG